MPRGGARNNKPTALRLLEGNPGKRPINHAEPQPNAATDLRPPSWMDATAKKCWREIAPELQALGLLADVDLNQLALYCQAYSRYRAALKALEYPATEDVKTWSVRLEKAEASMRLLASDFGMSPSARTRLSVAPQEREIDPMEDMLSGRRRA